MPKPYLQWLLLFVILIARIFHLIQIRIWNEQNDDEHKTSFLRLQNPYMFGTLYTTKHVTHDWSYGDIVTPESSRALFLSDHGVLLSHFNFKDLFSCI